MKFAVTSLVSSINSSLLSESEAITKDIVVANPVATIQNLRATVAIQFRLNVIAFDFRFDHHESAAPTVTGASATAASSSSAATVDWSDEKRQLTECGLQDGDHLTVVPKNLKAAAVVSEENGPLSKRARMEEEAKVNADPKEGGEAEEAADEEESATEGDHSNDDDSDPDNAEATAQNDLFEALREVVPDLTVLRQEFLANPQAVMERIERNHPSLFQMITQHQETFITLMNNEQLAKAAQSMLHGGRALGSGEDSLEWSMGEEGEEMEGDEEEGLDEETEAQMQALLQTYMANGGGNGDFSPADLAELEASGMQVGDVEDDEAGEGAAGAGGTALSDKEFILARVPSEEDEKKIQALTELGFSYEQCKLAFYMCHRSIDRASNMLFEAPPGV